MPPEDSNRHAVYGLVIQSDVPLTLPLDTTTTPVQIRIRTEPADFFAHAVAGARFSVDTPWHRYGRLADGSSYLRWDGLGEFLVTADGAGIACRRFSAACAESFHVYLLQRALSFAIVNQGLEPLHSTAVVVDGRAIAFLGRGGFGKSSLAAAFVHAGDRLLTDDLLLLGNGAAGPCVYPGPARIKLFPRMARRLLGDQVRGVPMNPDTRKLVMPLEPAQMCGAPVPLSAFYLLPSPRLVGRDIRVEALGPRLAFLEIIRHTFNYLDREPGRVARQFVAASRTAADVPMKRLLHPRRLEQLQDVRQALLADMGRN